ncbi:ATP-dependent RNA helicase, partial [Hortaea werneckii]
MAEDKPIQSEQDSSAPLAKSLDERLTFPDSKRSDNNNNTSAPSKFSWSDEMETPTVEKKSELENAQSDGSAEAPVGEAQKDGATTWLNGSEGLDEPEFDVNVKLADLQDDPNNPLYSAKAFEDLNLREELLRGLSVMSFNKPSKIQERALPLLLKNPPTNLIGQSQSGTGKTAAFVLNMLSRVDLSTKQPQCLVLAPTRELAKQIAGVANVMGAFLEDKGLTIAEAIPQSLPPRGQPLQGQIVVGTPGTVMDLIQRRRQLDVRAMKVLTLDEADNMLDMQGMGDQCKRVKVMLPPSVQVVLFSATFPAQVLDFAALFAPKANQITLEVEKLTVKGIKQMYLDCNSDEDKYNALVKFYGLMTIASSIIFVHRRDTAAEIERRMTAEGHKVASLTGALEGVQRDDVFNRFRSGEAKVLITT